MKEKILKAIYTTYNHSKELFEDANFLLDAGKAERAYTLYHFSFEEGGRFFILLKTLYQYLLGEIEANDLNYKLLKSKGYENHLKKLDETILKLMIYPINSTIMNDDHEGLNFITDSYNKLKSNIPKYNNKKNYSIYLSFVDNDFKLPKDLISNEDLNEIKDLAEIQLINIEKLLKEKSFIKPDEDLVLYKKNLIKLKEQRENHNEQSTNQK